MSRLTRPRKPWPRPTLDRPDEKSHGPSGLRRALWGLSITEAEHIFHVQNKEFTRARDNLEAQLNLLLIERHTLDAELDQLHARQRSLAILMEVLQERAVKEQAARTVLNARLLERQAEELASRQASTLAALRLEKARANAQLQQERESLRDLSTALYRVLAGRGAAPLGLEVRIDLNSQGSLPAIHDTVPNASLRLTGPDKGIPG